MFTTKVTETYITDEGTIVSAIDTQTGTAVVEYDGTVAATTDNQEVDIGFTQSEVKALMLYSSAALTVKTNSSSTPTQTLSLAAGVPLIWTVSHLESNPITANVTKFYLSNDTAAAATVKIRVLIT